MNGVIGGDLIAASAAIMLGSDAQLMQKNVTITENGTYTYDPADDNADGYSGVTVGVEVQGGSSPVVGHKFITANGTYTAADEQLDGYDIVVVDVPADCQVGTVTITQAWGSIPSVPNNYFGGYTCNCSFYIRETTTGRYVGRSGSRGFLKNYSGYASGTVITEEPLYTNATVSTLILPVGEYEYIEYACTHGTIATSSRPFTITDGGSVSFTSLHTLLAVTAFTPGASNIPYLEHRNTYALLEDNVGELTNPTYAYYPGVYSNSTPFFRNNDYGVPHPEFQNYAYMFPSLIQNNSGLEITLTTNVNRKQDTLSCSYYVPDVSNNRWEVYQVNAQPTEYCTNSVETTLTIDDYSATFNTDGYILRDYMGAAAAWYWGETSGQYYFKNTIYDGEVAYHRYTGMPGRDGDGGFSQDYYSYDYNFTTGKYKQYNHRVRNDDGSDANAFVYRVNHHDDGTDENLYNTVWSQWWEHDIPEGNNPYTYTTATARVNRLSQRLYSGLNEVLPKVESGVALSIASNGYYSPSSFSGPQQGRMYEFVAYVSFKQVLENKLTYIVP